MTNNKLIIFNFISFQAIWWLCVLSAKAGLSATVFVAVLVYTLLHLCLVEGWSQTLPLLLTALLGALADQFAYQLQWILFENHTQWPDYLPLWMLALWLAFATTLNVSMRWLQHKYGLALILGAVFGPLAYFGAQSLGAIQLPSIYSLVWFGLEWATLLPLMLWLRYRFNQSFALGHL